MYVSSSYWLILSYDSKIKFCVKMNKKVVVILICIVLVFGYWVYAYRKIPVQYSKYFINSNYEVPSDLNIKKLERKPHQFTKGFLKINGKTITMFLHGPNDFITNEILKNSIWELHLLKQIISLITDHPGIQLIDIGCNLGVYTLLAASYGNKVIAIDANRNNTDRLVQSVIENNLTNNVIVILNAVSNVKKEFSMDIVENNIGGQPIVDSKTNAYKVKSIFLDDLVPLISRDKKVMMKMDIEGSEINAMKKASKLFAERNVIAIFIEWNILKNDKDAFSLMNFLLKRNYRPFKDLFSKAELDISNYKPWPYDVVWKKM